MKNKKLNLKTLEIQSFITKINKDAETVMGGGIPSLTCWGILCTDNTNTMPIIDRCFVGTSWDIQDFCAPDTIIDVPTDPNYCPSVLKDPGCPFSNWYAECKP